MIVRRNFYFDHTCPKIDSGLRDIGRYFKSKEQELESLVADLRNEIDKAGVDIDFDFDQFSYLDDLKSEVESAFETIRESNSEMRDEAESQISSVLDDLSSRDEEISDLKDEIQDLKIKLSEYE